MTRNPSRFFVLIALLGITLNGCGETNSEPAGVLNHETEGNLVSKNKIGCPQWNSMKNTYTAADLYRGIPECVKEKDYEAAAFLFAIAGAYGGYDSLRVVDNTAHQAKTALIMKYVNSMSQPDRSNLEGPLSELFENPDKLEITCSRIRDIGHPRYFPNYMVEHGIQAFIGEANNKPLVSNFNQDSAWEQVLKGYLNCPG
jgi:hypothetical protein